MKFRYNLIIIGIFTLFFIPFRVDAISELNSYSYTLTATSSGAYIFRPYWHTNWSVVDYTLYLGTYPSGTGGGNISSGCGGYYDIITNTCSAPWNVGTLSTPTWVKIVETNTDAGTTSDKYWVQLSDSNGVIIPVPDTTTHIDNLIPIQNATTTSTTTISFNYYINSNDVISPLPPTPPFNGNLYPKMCIELQSLSFLPLRRLNCVNYNLDTYTTFSTTTGGLAEGVWQLSVYLQNPADNNTWFIEGGASTFAVEKYLEIGSDSAFASGTPPIFDSVGFNQFCNPISNNLSTLYLNPTFNVLNCTYYFFAPNPILINQKWDIMITTITKAVPLGYVTEFVQIISTTSTSTLTVLDITMPNGLPYGQNQNLTLSLSHVLDPYLNATTGIYMTSQASSTKTLYEITLPYWKILVSVMVLLYLLRRVIGNHLFKL